MSREEIDTGGARAKIFARIRKALDVDPDDAMGQAAVRDRLWRHPRNTIPMRARLYGEEAVRQFAEALAKQGADVTRASTPKQAVGAIGSYLGANNLPPRLRLGEDPVLAALPWKDAWDIERRFGPAEPADTASLSRAVAGVA